MSSSASLEVATALAVAACAGRPDADRTMLAKIGQRAENDFVGCNCGIMDQLVSAQGVEGAALLIDCRSCMDMLPATTMTDAANATRPLLRSASGGCATPTSKCWFVAPIPLIRSLSGGRATS